ATVRDRALREIVGDGVVPELLGRLDLDGHPPVAHAQCLGRVTTPVGLAARVSGYAGAPAAIPLLTRHQYCDAVDEVGAGGVEVLERHPLVLERVVELLELDDQLVGARSVGVDDHRRSRRLGRALLTAGALRARLGGLRHLAVPFSERAAALGQDELLRRSGTCFESAPRLRDTRLGWG